MSFIDSYKRLDRLCKDSLNDNRGISAYIDKMMNLPLSYMHSYEWSNDLKKLKHYRHIRNQIAHDVGCYEEDMCNIDDEIWLDDFYERIIKRDDPLSIYFRTVAKKKKEENKRPKDEFLIKEVKKAKEINHIEVVEFKTKKVNNHRRTSKKIKKHGNALQKVLIGLIIIVGMIFIYALTLFLRIKF